MGDTLRLLGLFLRAIVASIRPTWVEQLFEAENISKDIRRAKRKRRVMQEKIRIVFEGLRGEYSTAELILARRGHASSSNTAERVSR